MRLPQRQMILNNFEPLSPVNLLDRAVAAFAGRTAVIDGEHSSRMHSSPIEHPG